jgi:hypothetical protein
MWTNRLRRLALGALPPEKLIPDTQPAYVTSWVYLFGVLTVASLLVVLASGAVLALFGPAWWHLSSVGLFFNSVHLWSVELFFFFMALHLWGKFWMAAWRGRRGMTWVTGVVAFVVSIGTAFTGYLSQQNFDSQWIGVQGKDGLNAAGVGAFFNVLNFGQMLLWHVLLLPVGLGLLVLVHIVLVRKHGVVRPIPAHGEPDRSAEEWRGPVRRYDLIKELTVALAVITAVSLISAWALESPDEAPVTLASWSKADPTDFTTTALSELDGSTEVANYGPPYNGTKDAAQHLGPVSLQRFAGVHLPVRTSQDFVLGPLSVPADKNPALAEALTTYRSASPSQQHAWTSAYGKALPGASFSNGKIGLPPGDYGPVEPMMQALLTQAQSGGLDGALVSTQQFYQTDYTKPLLFLSDGGYLARLAQREHLLGSQWGMMNETGSYPGQAWLWLYTMWYQVPPFSSSANADFEIWLIMLGLTIALALVPWIPGIRSLPGWIPVHRLIWRRYHRVAEDTQAGP